LINDKGTDMRIRTRHIALLFTAGLGCAHAETLQLRSPDGALQVEFTDAAPGPSYSLRFHERTILAPSALGYVLGQGGSLQAGLTIRASSQRSVDQEYRLPVGKTSTVREHFNELSVDLTERGEGARQLRVILRAYDDGLAFRYVLPVQPALQRVDVQSELTQFAFADNYRCWGLNLGRYNSSHEGEFDPIPAVNIRDFHRFDSPLVCDTGSATFAIAEADLNHYAGMYLAGRGDGGLGVDARLSPRLDDPTLAVKSTGTTDTMSPWRVIMLADQAGKLIESNLMTSLNPPSAVQDTAWIKPGKAAWDWWNGPSLSSVAKPGMNNATMRGFIDFAAQSKLPYLLIDDGWYHGSGGAGTFNPDADPRRSIADIDMPALIAYAAERQVGLWVWLHWQTLDAHMDEALALYERWGLKGIKVDFMDRNDQQMVEFYHRLLRKTAEHHLMLDLHGAYAPTGLIRTWPHYLTQEGVLGAENNKWSRRITATHNVTLAYTRMLLGPMDYTPGGFRHATPAEFTPRFILPEVMTTRAQALAMYVVYDSPFSCVSYSPDSYAGQAGLDFISEVPTVWDETRFLQGQIGEYLVLARRKGDTWYLGAMNNETARRVRIPLDFLGTGAFEVSQYTDGAAPDQVHVRQRRRLATQSLSLELAANGGAAARLSPAQ
jgi:alpha-glucosidase